MHLFLSLSILALSFAAAHDFDTEGHQTQPLPTPAPDIAFHQRVAPALMEIIPGYPAVDPIFNSRLIGRQAVSGRAGDYSKAFGSLTPFSKNSCGPNVVIACRMGNVVGCCPSNLPVRSSPHSVLLGHILTPHPLA